jgi:CheY-like chemotaxis protein
MNVRALVVEDNVEFRTTAGRLLQHEGITVAGVAPTNLGALSTASSRWSCWPLF